MDVAWYAVVPNGAIPVVVVWWEEEVLHPI